jgi:hypothetical protein
VARWPAPEGVAAVTEFLRHLREPGAAWSLATRNQVLFDATHSAQVRTRQQCELFDRALASRT